MITTFTIFGVVIFVGAVIRLSGLEEIGFGGFRIKFSTPPKQIKEYVNSICFHHPVIRLEVCPDAVLQF